MNANHSAFFDRENAQAIRELICRPDMISQYHLLSRIDVPAVQAIVWELEPLIEGFDEKTRNFAIQSSGALIGDVLSARGFRIARDAKGEKRRGRVRKSRFVKTGTIWEEPIDSEPAKRAKVRAIMDDLLVRYRSTLEELAK